MKWRFSVLTACLALTYIQSAYSFPNYKQKGGTHCSTKQSILFTHISCSPLNDTEFSFIIGLATPILVDTKNEHPSVSNFHPWSNKATCTDLLAGISDNLCVYTNASFSKGRGISIFTTPQIASHFNNLPVLQDATALTGINEATGAWYTRSIPGKGIGMLASHSLKRGDLITAYTPILLVYMESVLSTMEREKYLRVAVEQLPQSSREAYYKLATIYGHAETIVQDVLKANTFEVEIGGHRHMAIFPETSRMNHDCGAKYV